jgi:hypothetical protein
MYLPEHYLCTGLIELSAARRFFALLEEIGLET